MPLHQRASLGAFFPYDSVSNRIKKLLRRDRL
jgi:hypothetical protein